jgi:hypothetical protein
LNDIASISDAQIHDDLEKGAEKTVPAKVTEEERGGEETGAEDCAIDEEGIRDECYGGEELFPNGKEDHENDTEDQKADYERSVPSFFLQCVEVEW